MITREEFVVRTVFLGLALSSSADLVADEDPSADTSSPPLLLSAEKREEFRAVTASIRHSEALFNVFSCGKSRTRKAMEFMRIGILVGVLIVALASLCDGYDCFESRDEVISQEWL
jgi:hypothetical protein